MKRDEISVSTPDTILIVAMVSIYFFVFFIAGSNPSAEVTASLSSTSLGKLCSLLGLAVYVCFRALKQSALLVAIIVLSFVSAGFLIIGLDNYATRIAIGFAIGLLDGTSLAYIGSCLFGFSKRRLGMVLCSGFAIGALITPLLRSVPGLNLGQIGTIFILAFATCALVLFVRQKLPCQTMANEPGSYSRESTPAKTILPSHGRQTFTCIVAMMMLFGFCFSVLEAYNRNLNYTYASSTASLAIASIAALALLALSSTKHLVGRQGNLWTILTFVLILASLASLAIAPLDHSLIALISAAFILANLALLVLITQSSNDDGISPLLRICVVTALLVCARTIGQSLGFSILSLPSTSYDTLQAIFRVAVGIATLGVTVSVFRSSWRADGLSGDDPPTKPGQTKTIAAEEPVGDSTAGAQAADDAFKRFCEMHELSNRERQIAWWYSQGYSAKAMAGKLHLSETTVRSYIQHVYTKTDLHSKQELIEAIERFAE